MGNLYPDYKPRGIRKDWDHCSMGTASSGDVLRKYFVPEEWGDPAEAVAWFAGDDLRVLVAEYPNGKRAVLRSSARGFNVTFPIS